MDAFHDSPQYFSIPTCTWSDTTAGTPWRASTQVSFEMGDSSLRSEWITCV